MEKILLIYNPNSGKKNIASHLDKIVDIFESAGKLITLYRIDEKNRMSMEEIIQNGSFDGIVVCGGDGSVNSVASMILKNGVDIPLGIIPNGTCNDFSRSLGYNPLRADYRTGKCNAHRHRIYKRFGEHFCKRACGRSFSCRIIFNRPKYEKNVRSTGLLRHGLGRACKR